MPIYEFYCAKCHVIFSFLSKSVNTSKVPVCPKCCAKLQRQVSMFAMGGQTPDGDDGDDLPVDESRLERAMEALAGEAEHINEDDPRQAADLMRKFSDMTGMELGEGMQEALSRMEAGEDPDAIEAELGDAIDAEDPFTARGSKVKSRRRRRPPGRDETLYEM